MPGKGRQISGKAIEQFLKRRMKKRKTFKEKVEQVLDKDIEFNYFSVGPTDHTLAAAGTIIPLSMIPQGDGLSQRIGRAVQLRSVRMRLMNTDGTCEFIRYILFFDNMCNGTHPTVANVLNSASWKAFPAFNNRKRFNIILDKTLSHEDFNNNHSVIEYYRRFNRKITYLGGGAGVEADNGKGSLYLLLISQAGGVADAFTYNVQLRYTDN